MTTWQSSRRYTEEERHQHSLAAMRRHPLALDPATVQRLAAESLQQAFAAKSPRMTGEFCGQTPAGQQAGTGHLATILQFRAELPSPLEQAAQRYLATPQAPNGLVKALAAEHGVDPVALLNRISALRHQHRFA